MSDWFRVYRKGIYPKPKKHFYDALFASRRAARNYCRMRRFEEGLTIVHPNGKEEPYEGKVQVG